MGEWVDPVTGVVKPITATWAELRARAESLRDSRPETPIEIDRVLRESEDLAFELADFKVNVNNDRYAAEIAFSKRKNAALAKHGGSQKSVTVARALAESDALTEFQELLAQKAIFHHVEDIQAALKQKHFGLMNTNAGIRGQVSTHAGRGA